MKKLGAEFARFVRGFGFAARGVALCIREERNFRFHLCAAGYVTALGVLAGFSRERFVLLFLCFGLMLGAEGFNTAIEGLCDRATRKREESIRNIKDVAAGAVLCCALASVGVGIALFGEKTAWAEIGRQLAAHPAVGVGLLVSLPIALGFIFLIGSKER